MMILEKFLNEDPFTERRNFLGFTSMELWNQTLIPVLCGTSKYWYSNFN